MANSIADELVPLVMSERGVEIAVRAYAFRKGQTAPSTLAVRDCRLAYNDWTDTLRIDELEHDGSRRVQGGWNARLSVRSCLDLDAFPVAERSDFDGSEPFVVIAIDTDPPRALVQQIDAWAVRWALTTIQPGASHFAIRAGDPLFETLASLLAPSPGGFRFRIPTGPPPP